ncbi:MAG: hypothetical protein AMXMBFR64_10520 [Myxococcales bacterium]
MKGNLFERTLCAALAAVVMWAGCAPEGPKGEGAPDLGLAAAAMGTAEGCGAGSACEAPVESDAPLGATKPWLVWAPVGATPGAGEAIRAALAELGAEAQLVTSLDGADLWAFAGVFGSLGAPPATYTPSAQEKASLATYVSSGGRLYLEGADAWWGSPTGLGLAFGIRATAKGGPALTSLAVTLPGPLTGETLLPPSPATASRPWDRLAPLTGAEALLVAGGEALMVGLHIPGHASTVGSSALFAQLTPGTTTPKALLAALVERLSADPLTCQESCASTGCGGACGETVTPECSAGGCVCPPGTADVFGAAALCSPIVDVAARHSHGCVITAAGTLHCWGLNGTGQLGVASTSRYEPMRVGKETGWTHVATGEDHTCGVRQGRLYCWGHDVDGKLGVTAGGFKAGVTQVGTSQTWQGIAAGDHHTCGIDAGALYCWGSGLSGQLGSPASGATVPAQVGSLTDWVSVSAGFRHTCGIRAGELYCWGDNTHGQLGDGTKVKRTQPVRIGDGADWQSVSASHGRTCGVRAGRLICWGCPLGSGTDSCWSEGTAPAQVGDLLGWSDVALSNRHGCALREGELWCFGDNTFRQCGPSVARTLAAPVRIGDGSDWQAISASHQLSCGVRGGALHCWGRPGAGPFGYALDASTPSLVGTPGGWTAVSHRMLHACGIRDGALYCWGRNENGELGTEGGGALPLRVGDETDWEAIATSNRFTCGVRAGRLYCWGDMSVPDSGLPVGVELQSLTPTQISEETGWTEVAAAAWDATACGIRAGELYCWGAHVDAGAGGWGAGYAQIPVPMGDESGWSGLTVGHTHACAIRSGSLHCWGQFWSDNVAMATSQVPVPLGTGAGWSAVSAGADHTCAIRDGELTCWGSGQHGVLGTPWASPPTQPPAPVMPPGGWQSTSVDLWSCGVRHGALYCWGDVGQGAALGQPSSVDVPLGRPTRVGAASDWTSVSVGAFAACGLRGGDALCWGSDELGPGVILAEPTLVTWP